ncbi:Protein pellino [Amphibalanus amphitrite]|uniref:Protein pellino n=1 Tax=Amphibalanus amphitrite TaxID=1232801 RepID=A0A6A4VCY2_AMPAM|nr:Protein pellino [Amphibalanus amphitrite]
MHRHKVAFIRHSYAIRLSRMPRGLGASCGRLFVGFEADASCAGGGLGANLDVDLRWLRSQVCDLSMRDVHPDFAVISFGGNALARRPEPDRSATLVANVEEAKRACVYELREVFDQMELMEGVHALVLSTASVMRLCMGMEPSFHVDWERPTHAFSPCAHMDLEATVRYWSAIMIPHGTNGCHPMCPFWATPLSAASPHVRLIFQCSLD